ncbi:hypothetical protein IEO21_07419 [Rhodonia placenta]|uniref:Uncharacterized protein n=1 Tax=Rhodonia placenta TaxID=104341 RepID=A0A8H7NYK5_9APHY|nr:hypothetical protein IEO21_07419 [Postia placenta]
MRTFQVLLLFLGTLAATVLADSYAHEDHMVARDVWDDDTLFARDEDALYARDDELYARDLEEYKDHPLVREIVNVVARAKGNRLTSCYNNSEKLTEIFGKYYYCVNKSGDKFCVSPSNLQVENGECFN